MAGRRRRFFLYALGNFGKIAGIAEVFIDARKPNVGDMVQRLETCHNRLADTRRSHFVAERFHLPLNAAYQSVDAGSVDVALAASMADGAGKLVAVEWFAFSILLDDREIAQLDPLEGRESSAASLALPPTADRSAIFAWPAVLNLAVFMRAERAAHPLSLIDRKTCAKLAHALVHIALNLAIIFETIDGKAIENIGNHVGNSLELGFAEAAGCSSR